LAQGSESKRLLIRQYSWNKGREILAEQLSQNNNIPGVSDEVYITKNEYEVKEARMMSFASLKIRL